MSTIIRTEFGNYDVWNGRIYQISPQLRQALQGRQVNSPAEMQAAIQFLREKRNRETQEARTRAEQERRRAELLQSELQLIAALQNRQAVATAAEQSNRRVEQQRNERQRRAEQVDSNVSPAIRDMRQQQNRTINEMERNVQESMRQMHSQLETRLNTLETAVQGVNRLTEAVGEIERRIERQFEQQQQQVETVEKSNQLDRFVPEEAESVRRRLQNLQQSQASGAELAALANEVIIAGQELEIKCNRERLKYEQKEEMTRTMLETVLEIVNKNREIELSDDQGNPVKVENNFWSKGQYNALLEKLNALRQEIIDHGQTDMSIDRLDQIQKEIVEAEEEIRNITAQSVQRVMLSQARMQAVYDIVDAMEDQHWQVIETNGEEEIDYKGGDMASDFREGAFARLRNSMGEEVTVMVDPDEEQQKNTIGFHFSGGRIDTDEENERKTAKVAEQLKQSGYELGVPKCAGHMPMPEMESAAEMTRQGASERIREREQTEA